MSLYALEIRSLLLSLLSKTEQSMSIGISQGFEHKSQILPCDLEDSGAL